MLYAIVLTEILLFYFIQSQSRVTGKAARRVLWAVLFLTLAIISSCRYETGARSDFYKNYINCVRTGSKPWNEILTWGEEMFHPILRKVVMTLFNDPQMWFAITSFFIIGAFFHAFRKYTTDRFLAVVLFYCIGGYFTAHNITRQFIAIGIVLFSLKYIMERKLIPFLLTVMLACGFHISAAVMIPLYFLSNVRFNRNALYLYIVFFVLAAVLRQQFTAFFQLLFYSDYGSGYGAETSNALRLIWPVITVFCIWLCNRPSVRLACPAVAEGESEKRFKNMLCHGAALYCFFSLLSATSMLLFSRIASYFAFFAHLSMLYAMDTLRLRSNKTMMRSGLLLLVIAWFLFNNIQGKLDPTPYTPFWEAARLW